jgi:hypothetical protein
VNEADVGMALLMHHSFPDEIELANGVATLTKGSGSSANIMLVTQLGATSVANPEPGSFPEEVRVVSTRGFYPTLVTSSSLVPLGAKVMDWKDDYTELAQLNVDAAEKFEQVTGKTKYVLDFEYKKVAPGGAAFPPGGLVVKQIRQIPQPDTTKNITPFLLNNPSEYCIFQGEYSDVFAIHRLKSRWIIGTKNMWLTPENLDEGIYGDVHIEYKDDCRIRDLVGMFSHLPFASQTFNGSTATHSWRMHHLANPRNYELQTTTPNIPTSVSLAESPFCIVEDFRNEWGFFLPLNVEYDKPVKRSSPDNTTTTESVGLWPCRQPQPVDLLQQRSVYDEPNDVNITTSFYWPPHPTGPIGGYTAPLISFVETVIEGYTTEPIVLRSYYSQTYRPGHHNFSEFFLFEPQLEPGISQSTLDELKARDIRLIYMSYSFGSGIIKTYGFEDDSFIPGDFEPDGDVDLADFARLAIRWQDTVCDACGKADLTGDGRVDLEDIVEFAENWLKDATP